MKKQLLCFVVPLLLLALFCACGPAPQTEPPLLPVEPQPVAPAAPSQVRLLMATGGASGTYYPYGGALALAIHAATGYVKITVTSTGASVENIQQISAGLAHLAIVQNDVMNYAYHGINTWTAAPVTNMTTLMSLYPEFCQLVVSADSEIYSVADLMGKRVSVGDVGSGVFANAIQILEAYEMTVADIDVQYQDFAGAAEALQEGSIDAFFVTSSVPNAAVTKLAVSREIRLISLEQDKIDSLMEKYPFYTVAEITHEDYPFLTDSVTTVAVLATLIASPELDEQVAYDIVKSIIESKESIMVAHAKGAYIDPAYAVQGISVDLHPGAAKYFRELGVL